MTDNNNTEKNGGGATETGGAGSKSGKVRYTVNSVGEAVPGDREIRRRLLRHKIQAQVTPGLSKEGKSRVLSTDARQGRLVQWPETGLRDDMFNFLKPEQ
jgi:hypothetical protein